MTPEPFSAMMLYISSHNYPGGAALMQLQEIESPKAAVNVHIDVYAAQTGVSRFLQVNDGWTYNKTEDLDTETLAASFTHLLVESQDNETLNSLQGTLSMSS